MSQVGGQRYDWPMMETRMKNECVGERDEGTQVMGGLCVCMEKRGRESKLRVREKKRTNGKTKEGKRKC